MSLYLQVISNYTRIHLFYMLDINYHFQNLSQNIGNFT